MQQKSVNKKQVKSSKTCKKQFDFITCNILQYNQSLLNQIFL